MGDAEKEIEHSCTDEGKRGKEIFRHCQAFHQI